MCAPDRQIKNRQLHFYGIIAKIKHYTIIDDTVHAEASICQNFMSKPNSAAAHASITRKATAKFTKLY